ncbi:hypothetical protein ACHZ97_09475 [Lysobacter soli]|uniref:hypothetical protein n=1 Tax=Lysobacter soli TaxID=453783 RepID=UPI0037CA36D8
MDAAAPLRPTAIISVNGLIEQLAELDGQPVQVEGVLVLEPEGYELQHYPNSERLTTRTLFDSEYRPGIWIAFGDGALKPNHVALERWTGKRVRVVGIVKTIATLSPAGSLGRGGFGPWGFWPAQIEPYSVQRVTADERREEQA